MGETLELTAVALDTAGQPIDTAGFTWSSNRPAAASVDAEGTVSALGAGTATIRATSGGVSGEASLVVTPPPLDIGVVYISRSPRIPPPESRDEPAEAGWPSPGQTVTWEAHVFNLGQDTAHAVPWTWRVDGNEELAGSVDLPPGETVVELARPWAFEHRRISFAVDPPPGDLDDELDELTVWSDALSLGLWVAQSIHDWMAEAGGPPAWEWWVRRESDEWNRTLDAFHSPVIPDGIVDRFRLDWVEVRADDAGFPDEWDTDFSWFFHPTNPVRHLAPAHGDAWRDQTVVLHELIHQRGIVDIYAYAVSHNGGNQDIRIRDAGGLAAGSTRMPFVATFDRVYVAPFDSVLMGRDYTRPSEVTEHTAFGLNLYAGRRTPLYRVGVDLLNDFEQRGNPYVGRLPEVVEVEVLDPWGEPIGDAELDVFVNHGQHTYQLLYNQDPDYTVRVDAAGIAILPPQFANPIPDALRPKASTTILRARRNGQWGYGFLPTYYLNVAWIRGERDRTRVPVRFTFF